MSGGLTNTSRNPSDTARVCKSRVLVGDRNEALGPSAVPLRSRAAAPHRPSRLARSSIRFAGKHEQRASHESSLRVRHPDPRNRAWKPCTTRGTQHLPEDFRCQARAAHPKEHDIGKSGVTDSANARRARRRDEVSQPSRLAMSCRIAGSSVQTSSRRDHRSANALNPGVRTRRRTAWSERSSDVNGSDKDGIVGLIT